MIHKSLIAAADSAPHTTAGWFSAYGPSHLTVLVIFVMGSAALVGIGRRQTESQARLFSRALAALTLVLFAVALLVGAISAAGGWWSRGAVPVMVGMRAGADQCMNRSDGSRLCWIPIFERPPTPTR